MNKKRYYVYFRRRGRYNLPTRVEVYSWQDIVELLYVGYPGMTDITSSETETVGVYRVTGYFNGRRYSAGYCNFICD